MSCTTDNYNNLKIGKTHEKIDTTALLNYYTLIPIKLYDVHPSETKFSLLAAIVLELFTFPIFPFFNALKSLKSL